MKIHYLNRGYPESLIESSRLRALSKDRSELLNPCPVKNKQNAKNENVVPLILTHHPSNYLVRKIINDNWNILKYSDLCQKALPESPLFTTRRASNIKDILVHSRLKPKGNDHNKRPNVKSEKCKRPFCGICKKLKNTNVVCTLTKKSHQLPLNIDCHTRNVVYVLTCEQCKKQYVGETKRNFYVRFKEHIAGIKHKRSYPVTSHCLTHSNVNPETILSPKILEVIPRNPDLRETDDYRKKRELHWILKFRSLTPNGLNIMGQ